MPILATNPTVKPAEGEITFDELWFKKLVILAEDPNSPVRVTIEVAKSRLLPDGSRELAPSIKGEKVSGQVIIEDLYALVASDPTKLGTLIQNLLSAAKEIVEAKGVV